MHVTLVHARLSQTEEPLDAMGMPLCVDKDTESRKGEGPAQGIQTLQDGAGGEPALGLDPDALSLYFPPGIC